MDCPLPSLGLKVGSPYTSFLGGTKGCSGDIGEGSKVCYKEGAIFKNFAGQ